jgi:hypothetical protein
MFLNFFSVFSFSSLRGNYLSLWLGSFVIRAETFPPEIITVFDSDNFQFWNKKYYSDPIAIVSRFNQKVTFCFQRLQ